ncbi:MAG: hypothetical protein NUV50_00010 [Rhodospirillales bacterium]|nr:hypothetical protein [Rhodospirillales bacterium]
MADNPKAAWPKTPDGTTDWQYVFEDPTAGFIPLIARAQSTDALKMIATVILQKLFSRKNDVDELHLHLAHLGSIIEAGGNIEGMAAQINTLMRKVKNERIEKARVYVERKKAGAAIDRRSGLLWRISKLLEPRVLVPLGGLVVLALSGLIYMVLQSAVGTGTSISDAVVELDQAKKQAAKDAEQASLPPSDTQQPAPEAKPILVLFQSVRWPQVAQFTTDRPQYYSVVLSVKNWEQKVEICRRLPAVMDRFYSSFSDVMPPNRPARDAEIDALEKDIVGAINTILPESYVTEAAVARYGTREFRISPRPPYCSSPSN